MYEIFWKGSRVGNATIYKEGLYYRINCSCNLPKTERFRVTVTDGDNTYDLGICVPAGNVYSCVASMPCKRFSGSDFIFTITDGAEKKVVPVDAGEPFSYLDKLSTARLQYANGQPEIVINAVQDQQDNDQNPIHQHKLTQL